MSSNCSMELVHYCHSLSPPVSAVGFGWELALDVCVRLLNLCCASLQCYRATLCTIDLRCAPPTCVVHHYGAMASPLEPNWLLIFVCAGGWKDWSAWHRRCVNTSLCSLKVVWHGMNLEWSLDKSPKNNITLIISSVCQPLPPKSTWSPILYLKEILT